MGAGACDACVPSAPTRPLWLLRCWQDSIYLHSDEAELVGMPDATAAADEAADGAAGNGTAWLGCIVAPQAVMAGSVLGTLDGVVTAEECCRECRAYSGCNVWNLCQELGGCRCVAHSWGQRLSPARTGSLHTHEAPLGCNPCAGTATSAPR